MTIFENYQQYMDSQGLVQLSKDRSVTDNGIRWTTEAYMVLQKNNQLTSEIKSELVEAIEECEDQAAPGLFHRSKDKRNQEGPDDYCALIAFSAMSGHTDIAERVLTHGQQKFCLKDIDLTGQPSQLIFLQKILGWLPIRYNYNDIDQNKITQKSWLGRFPALICAMKYAAGKKPNLFEFIYFICSLIFSATRPKQDYDAKSLSFLLIAAVSGKNWLIDIAIKYWKIKLIETYPNGMHDVWASYFQNSEYPTVKYSKP